MDIFAHLWKGVDFVFFIQSYHYTPDTNRKSKRIIYAPPSQGVPPEAKIDQNPDPILLFYPVLHLTPFSPTLTHSHDTNYRMSIILK